METQRSYFNLYLIQIEKEARWLRRHLKHETLTLRSFGDIFFAVCSCKRTLGLRDDHAIRLALDLSSSSKPSASTAASLRARE